MKQTISLILILVSLLSCNSKTENEKQDPEKVSNYSKNRVNKDYTKSETKERSYFVKTNNEIIKQDCSETHSSADDAYSYCRKAYNSDDIEEVKSYLKKAMGSFEDAMSSAEDCKCDDAHSAAEDGYNYAKKGYRNDDFEEIKRYAKKAKSVAEDVMSKADDCSK